MNSMDFRAEFDRKFCLFCFAATSAMFFDIWGLSWLFVKNRALLGAFAQISVCSSAAIWGIDMGVHFYGSTGMVPMMIMASVPFFNAYSVVILSLSIPFRGFLLHWFCLI